MKDKNEVRTKTEGTTYIIYCPHCKGELASGFYMGVTITLYENCPYCNKELNWKKFIGDEVEDE